MIGFLTREIRVGGNDGQGTDGSPMSFYLDRAISLHRRPLGERELLLTLFSLERGKNQVIVRGTSKPGSSLRAAAEPLNEGLYYIARRRGMDLLTEWEPVCHFPGIRRTPEALSLALYFIQYPLRAMPPAEPEPRVWFLLKNTLLTLESCKEYHICRLVFESGFLGVTGHGLQFDRCSACGKGMGAGRWQFHIAGGGVLCEACSPEKNPRYVAPFSLEAAKFGKNIARVSDVFASGTFSTGECGDPAALNKALDAAARGTARTAIRQLRDAVSKFARYQLNEPVDKWLVEI